MKTQTKVHIIGGTGQMGSWLCGVLTKHNYEVSVSGKTNSNIRGIKNCDLLIISVPIEIAPLVIQKALPLLKKEACIVDLSSLMSLSAPVLVKSNHPSAFLHFLFGPSVTDMQNQHIVTNIIKPSSQLTALFTLFEHEGAQMHSVTTNEHDIFMAHIQALTHFSNLSLAHTLFTNHIGLFPDLTTPTFLTQTGAILRVITNNSAELLANIQLHNPYVPQVLTTHLAFQKKLLNLIKKKNLKTLTASYSSLQTLATPKKQIEKEVSFPLSSFPFSEKDTLAYLGPEGTFSHQAAQGVIQGNKISLLSKPTIRDIFESVSNGEATIGIVPAENSTEGTIRETLDHLTTYPVISQFSYELPIHQNLLSEEKNLSAITTVISHPQGIGQCQQWLHQNLPHAELRFAKSTVSDIEDERKNKGTSFICSELVSTLYNLPILSSQIEDRKENITKFYVITNPSHKAPVITNRTLLFLSIFNRVGVLKDILSVFATYNINLNKIESRPSQQKVWDYYFFVEIEIRRDDPRLESMRTLLKLFCPEIKLLGSV